MATKAVSAPSIAVACECWKGRVFGLGSRLERYWWLLRCRCESQPIHTCPQPTWMASMKKEHQVCSGKNAPGWRNGSQLPWMQMYKYTRVWNTRKGRYSDFKILLDLSGWQQSRFTVIQNCRFSGAGHSPPWCGRGDHDHDHDHNHACGDLVSSNAFL